MKASWHPQVAQLCQYNVKIRGQSIHDDPMLALKTTTFLSSAHELLKMLGRRCARDQVHQPFTGGAAAAGFTRQSCAVQCCAASMRNADAKCNRCAWPLRKNSNKKTKIRSSKKNMFRSKTRWGP